MLHFISAENIFKPLQGILDSLVDLHISHRLIDDFLILCPDNTCSEDIQTQLLQNPKLSNILTGESVLSLKRYIEKSCDELWPQTRKAAPYILQGLLKSVLAQHLHPQYAKLSQENLILLLDSFRNELLPPSSLLHLLESFDPELARECVKCFQEYQNQIDKHAYLKDFSWQSQEVLKCISEKKLNRLNNIRRIYYLGFIDFSPLLKKCLQAIHKAFPEIEQITLIQKPKATDIQDYFTKEWGEIPPQLHEFKDKDIDPPPPLVHEYRGGFNECSDILQQIIHRIEKGQKASSIAIFLPREAFLKSYFEKQLFNLGLLPKHHSSKTLSHFPIIQNNCQNSFTDTLQLTQKLLHEKGMISKTVQDKEAEELRALNAWKDILEEIIFYEEEYPFLKPYLPTPVQIINHHSLFSQVRPHEGIQIRPLNQTGLRKFECVFIPQLSDDLLPQSPERFFGFPLPHFERQLFHQRSIFQHLLNSGRETQLSFSRTGLQAEEKSASPFILEFNIQKRIHPISPLWVSHSSNNIAEALSVEIQRLTDLSYKYKHGAYIQNPQSLQKLRHWVEHKKFSPSRLETYAQCPFTFYVQSLLGINIEEEKSLEGDPREQGKWVHELLENFFSTNIELLKSSGTNPSLRQNALELLKNDADKLKEKFLGEKNWIHPILFDDFSDRVVKSAHEILQIFWKQWDESKSGPPLIPRFFEKEFGVEENIFFKKEGLPPFKLKGRIDRIDVSEDGQSFVTWDYKTGELNQLSSDIKNFKKLQLPLYLWAASKMKELSNKDAIASLALGLKELIINQGIAKKDKAKVLGIHSRAGALLDENQWDHFWQDFEFNLLEYFENIYKGDFRTRPDPCSEFCEYKYICRYHDRTKA